jgi:hypothetical protein
VIEVELIAVPSKSLSNFATALQPDEARVEPFPTSFWLCHLSSPILMGMKWKQKN